MDDDGLAYVKEADCPNHFGASGAGSEPALRMGDGTAAVPDNIIVEAVRAANRCPAECILFDDV